MIVPDTSIWIEHFRSNSERLRKLLEGKEIAMHPFVISELSLGSLRNRKQTLADLDSLPRILVAQTEEVRSLVENKQLFAKGIGFVDAHLIASALISKGYFLWTSDRRLREVAESLGVHANQVP